MYIVLALFILIIGLLLLCLPKKLIVRCSELKGFPLYLRLLGSILILVGILAAYGLLSGAVVLPLVK